MNFTKKYLASIQSTASIIQVFESFGFEVKDMNQYQNIMNDLMNVLTGGTGKKKRGRPAKNALSSGVAKNPVGRPRKKKRGRPAGFKVTKPYTGKKRERKPKLSTPVAAE